MKGNPDRINLTKGTKMSVSNKSSPKVQKTIYGYSAKKIINRIKTVKTMGGHTKEIVTIPTFAGTISHWDVSRGADLVVLSSGSVSIVLMLA